MTKPHPPGYISPRLPLPDPKREKFARLVGLDGVAIAVAYTAAGYPGRAGVRLASVGDMAARIAHLAKISESHRKPAQPVASPPSVDDDPPPVAPVDAGEASPSPSPVPPAGPIDMESELTRLYHASKSDTMKVRILGQISALRRFGEDPEQRTGKTRQAAQRAPSPSHAAIPDTLADSELFAQLAAGKANPETDSAAFRAALIAAGEDPRAQELSAPAGDTPARVPQPPTRHLIP